MSDDDERKMRSAPVFILPSAFNLKLSNAAQNNSTNVYIQKQEKELQLKSSEYRIPYDVLIYEWLPTYFIQ